MKQKVSDEETHKRRMSELNGAIVALRAEMGQAITSTELHLKEEYNARVLQYTNELNAEKEAVLRARKELEIYIRGKKGELSDIEKIQEGLLRAFRVGVEDEKNKLMGHFDSTKVTLEERLRGAKNQYGLSEDNEKMRLHNAQKQSILIEIDELNKSVVLEREAFNRERAEWRTQHESWKKHQLTLISEERARWYADREAQQNGIMI